MKFLVVYLCVLLSFPQQTNLIIREIAGPDKSTVTVKQSIAGSQNIIISSKESRTGGRYRMEVLSSEGKVLCSFKMIEKTSIGMHKYNCGVYLLRLKSLENNRVFYYRIEKKKN